MGITGVSSQLDNRDLVKKKRRSGRPGSGSVGEKASFKELWETGQAAGGEKSTVEEYLAELEQAERELLERPSLMNFQHYRQQVRGLAGEVLRRAYRITSWQDRQQRQFEVVRVVDKNLANILAQLTRPSTDLRIILHTMGEIKGLLLDELR